MRCSLGVLLLVVSGGLLPDTGAADEGGHPDPERWRETIDQMVAAAPAAVGDDVICFIGSSSIRLWDLNRDFPDHNVVNRGFGGSVMADATHYLDQLVFPHRPGVVVVYAGDNDIAHGLSPGQVAEDYAAFVERLRTKLPKAQVVYISIKPSLARWDRYPQMAEANQQIRRQIESDPRATYVDICQPMLGPDDQPRPELFVADGLHLNDRGYEVWRAAVAAALPAAQQTGQKN
ncbi:MAG: SGNH/GDSL hydrolase family protein [Planctomycetota bacterium]